MNSLSHTIRVGAMGCGKSEILRKELGLTHQEYEKLCADSKKALEESVEFNEKQKAFHNALWMQLVGEGGS
jgi:hypothetical protein